MTNGPATNGPMTAADGQSPSERSTIAALTFDRALEELQATVAQLEAGGQPLEEAIVLYERGVALHEHCARLLADAELRVKRLVERAGGALEAMTMEPGEADAAG
jgi:exodeoxyribonuclease VII small subunit